jgi:guanylate kinase
MPVAKQSGVRLGRLVVLSGPSGVGKTSVVKRLLEICPLPLHVSVSATTRPPRTGELHGVEYYFFDAAEFERRRQLGEFIECVEVYGQGYWYGTLRSEVVPRLKQGQGVLLEIDVQGAGKVLGEFPDAITIFVGPESWAELESRLRGRGTESEQAIQRRLAVARSELDAAVHYQHRVVNRTLDQVAQEICDVLQKAGELHD